MSDELVPEMHDILKLAKKQKLNKDGEEVNPHSQPELLVNRLSTKTWEGICKHHHGEGFETWPDSPDLFVLDMADILAAATSRAFQFGYYERYEIDDEPFKLWKDYFEDIERGRHNRPLDIEEVIEFVSRSPSAEDYIRKYGQQLLHRAEETKLGINITSLMTHSLLAGKFYRILRHYKQEVPLDILSDKRKVENFAKNIGWKLTILKIKIHFPQSPVRARDMNVFKILEDFVDDIKTEFQDNVLFSTSNELRLVSPVGGDVFESIKKKAKEVGFWLDIRQDDKRINELNLEEIGHPSSEYPSLSPDIGPRICEVCQMASGTRDWVTDTLTEHLCEKCYSIRELGARLPKIGDWEESTENPKVAYLKILLDVEELVSTLKGLYFEYIGHFGIQMAEKRSKIRFPVIAEFQGDYDAFLSTLETRIAAEYGEASIQKILGDFFCIKVEEEREIKKLLEIYGSTFKECFPKFMPNSPIKLSVTCANVKFPFIWNWKLLEKPKEEVNVSLIGKGEMNLKLKQLDELFNMRLPSRKLLIDLSKAAEISKKLAWVMLNDKGDRRARRTYREFEGFRRAITSSGIDYDSILVFAKMMGS
ncbi:MAG: hypothetical protein JW878_02230 [Methanomicrobia archaeon]|nr:hypothetical protein [Methanomicrobia archaeon]